MDNIVDYLKQLDLSDVEAKLYLTLLQTGPASVRDLAQTIEIKRTTAYFYIDQLVEKGLIIKLIKGSKKLVAANEPENLQTLVEEKLQNAKIVKQEFPDILKALNKAIPQKNNVKEAEIKYYKGVNGVKKIYEEALQSKELRSYANLTIMEGIFPENLHLFSNAFKNNRELKMFEIVEDSDQAHKQTNFSSKNERYFFKFLPNDVKLSAADILIYDGKVSIINIGNQITGVIFQNPEYYSNTKELFDFNWRVLPEVIR